jgi:Ribosomal protein L3
MRGLIGKKMGMTRIYDENGLIVPVTLIQAGPCTVNSKSKPTRKMGMKLFRLGMANGNQNIQQNRF